MHPRFIAIAALLLVTAACDGQRQADGGGPPEPVEVSVVTVQEERLPLYTELPGRTAAYRVAEVRPQVSGIVLKRLFDEGSEVAAGQQLYQIAPTSYEVAVQGAQADLARARANLRSAETRAARYSALVKVDAVSRQNYDDAMAALDQAKAQVLVAEAAVETARINLEYTKVYAPIGGRIGKSNVTEGALVTAHQAGPMAIITQLDPIYVDLRQSSAELMELRSAAGAAALEKPPAVHLLLDGADRPYEQVGQLQFADVTVDPTSGAVQLRAVFPNPHKTLYPGLFVRARVDRGVRENAILLPQQALVRNPDGTSSVWVVGPDAKVEPRPVRVERAIGDKWLVESGLRHGDRVVVAGLQKVQPGAEVRVAAPSGQP